jgi:hypothetical protein
MEMEYPMDEDRRKDRPIKGHYYGDVVRRIFIAIGAIMISTAPFFKTLIPTPVFISVIAVVVICIAAGAANPRQRFASIINFGISITGFILLEYYAILSYDPAGDFRTKIFFLTNQLLAILFFIAIYYSTKTIRAFYIYKS